MDETLATPDVDWESVLRDLDTPCPQFPEAAIRTCQQHPAEAVPRLIEVIERATEQVRRGAIPEGMAHCFALYLLAEFRAREALPAILSAISLPGEEPFDLFGDSITEDLDRILAILAEDRPEFVESLIENQQLNEYVRNAAALAFRYWVRDGLLTRSLAVERLRHHLRMAIERSDSIVPSYLLLTLGELNGFEAQEEADEAERLNLINYEWFDEGDFAELVNSAAPDSLPELERLKSTAIEDTVKATQWWASFDEEEHREQSDDELDLNSAGDFDITPWMGEDGGESASILDDAPDAPAPWGTVHNQYAHVGRNDPCPCGSGKKFKKCCLRKQSG